MSSTNKMQIKRYVSEVQKLINKKHKLSDSKIRVLLQEHHEVVFDLIFTFESNNPQERLLMFFPEDITEDEFLALIFNELGNMTRYLVKISCCQMYCSTDVKNSNVVKFSLDRNGKYYFNVDINNDADTRRLNKIRLAFVESLSNKLTGGSSSKKSSLGDIYWDYVESPPTKKITIERHENVYNKVLTKLEKEDEDPMDFIITAKIVKYIYTKIDKEFFDGLISPYLESSFGADLKCGIASKMKTTAGWFSFGDDSKTPTMMIADKVFAKFFTHGEKSITNGGFTEKNRLGFLIRTIEHELCHLLLAVFDYKNSNINKGHGPAFRTFVLHAFRHTDYHHAGFSGDTEVADRMKSELRIGNLVEYNNKKGKSGTGKVIKLGSNSVLIHGAANGISYGNVIRIIDHGTEPVPLDIDISKLKIGQELYIQKKTKSVQCKLISMTDARAHVECDGKRYSAPWGMIRLS